MPDDFNKNTSIEDEIEKSLQKMVEEETTVAKAYVGNADDYKAEQPSDINDGRTRVVPKITDEILKEQQVINKSSQQTQEELTDRDILLDDDDDEEPEDEDKEILKDATKKPLDKKTKLIIAGVAAGVALVLIIIIIVAVSLNKKSKNNYDYYYQTGMKLYEEGNYGDASSYLSKASKENEGKKNLNLKYTLYRCYESSGNEDEAVNVLKDILSYDENYEDADNSVKCDSLEVKGLTFAYPGGSDIFENVTFEAEKGSIIGVTGSVACGKSTLGKVFLCEYPYKGSIKIAGNELSELDDAKKAGLAAYLGHDPELFNDTIRNNILMGDDEDVAKLLKAVCFDKEVNDMENGQDTYVGNTGVRLSGGQAQRLALARTLCHKKPLIILDDPFSALDKDTEREVFANIKEYTKDCIVILISHRLYLFPQMDKVIWMENGKTIAGTHDEIMNKCPQYAVLYNEQKGDASDEE